MKWFEKINGVASHHALGLMSGTSADGLDIAWVKIEPRDPAPEFTLLDFTIREYAAEIKQKILSVAAPDGGSVEDVCRLNFFLGHLFSGLILDYLQEKNISAGEIDFIGSHGQTICHLPEKIEENGIFYASTLQVADPSVIANQTGILTVGDFRIADMALGGQGAPLVPFFDALYFHHPQRNRIVLNIGGIANITYVPAELSFEEVVAFDTGPGNVIIDSLARRYFKQPFDKDGEIAKSGSVHRELLTVLLQDGYFSKEPPKSTGREKFAGPFLQQIYSFIENEKIAPADLIATATELTARTIYDACVNLLHHSEKIDELIISGGGVENPVLMTALAKYFSPVKNVRSDELGLLSEAKEATCFAMMACQTLLSRPANLPSVTGASRQTILGKICLPG